MRFPIFIFIILGEFAAKLGRRIDISEKIKPTWEILPKRWVVERIFSWMNYSRRLSKDYEITTDSEKNFIFYFTHAHVTTQIVRKFMNIASYILLLMQRHLRGLRWRQK